MGLVYEEWQLLFRQALTPAGAQLCRVSIGLATPYGNFLYISFL